MTKKKEDSHVPLSVKRIQKRGTRSSRAIPILPLDSHFSQKPS